jgi:hypothetical protein
MITANEQNIEVEDCREQLFQIMLNNAPHYFDTTEEDEIDFMLRFLALIRIYIDELEKYFTNQFFEGSNVVNHFSQVGLDDENGLEIPNEFDTFLKIKNKGIPKMKMRIKTLTLAEDLIVFLLDHQNSNE